MFNHLHVHTEYSLLDGMCRITRLVSRAKELGMDSLAITDHGVLHGAVDFYLAAKEAGVKPIIGCEIYLALSDRRSREATEKKPYHLILLVKNDTGYRNLIQIVTKTHLESFYYKPRADKELLAQHHQGLIALSACANGELPRLILEGQFNQAKSAAKWYREVFGDYYIEIQRQPIPELEQVNQGLLSISREMGIPLVATNDVHYIDKKDASAHDLLLCIQTNTSIYDQKRMKMAGDFFYLKSPEEMAYLYQDIPQAIENTRLIADMCSFEMEFGRLHLPAVETPPGKTADEYLAELCWQGLRHSYPQPTPEVEQRLLYELDVIRQTQFADYFLVVWDIISFTRQRRILFGVRGSAAASIVLYCLEITEIDPLKNNLVFERFLNIERRELPDIDLDFQDDRRDEVISYVSQKYGPSHVAQIITFGTLGARAAIRDCGRALGMSYSDADRVARLIPFGTNITLDDALKENRELDTIYREDALVRKLVDSAMEVEGTARHASTHAAGIVISREPLTQYMPLQLASKTNGEAATMTQFSMEAIAKIGLLKMDFLGLANLSILSRAKELIGQNRGIEIDLYHLPMGDAKTFTLLASGETSGIFQLEGAGMRRYIKELKPSSFSDIAAMIALYRPGPMEQIPTFIKAKHGIEPIRYPHPALARILEETYGVIVYQDQVLFIVQAFAGYSLGQADIFRKAMGKKIPEVMKKERQNFIAGAKRKGFSQELATQIFDLIEPFAGYAFNKAHSVSYAMISYQTAYLKANYPVEYMAAFLISHAGQSEKVRSAIAECRRLGIPILPPDINRSEASFAIERSGQDNKQSIRFGLAAIKNVGASAIEPILAAREAGGYFKSIEDLCRRTDLRRVNKRVLESLVKVGALDCLGSRGALLDSLDRIISLSQQEQQLRETGQTSMFDLWGNSVPLPLPSLELTKVDTALQEKLNWEKELLGVYLSEHPFSYVARSTAQGSTLCGQIDAEMAGQTVVVVGMVNSMRELSTKDNRPFATATLEDLDGSIEVTVWPEVYRSTKELWKEGNILLVAGKVKVRNDRIQLTCDSARRHQPQAMEAEIQETAENQVSTDAATTASKQRLIINISQTNDEEGDRERLLNILNTIRRYPGQAEVHLVVNSDYNVVKLEMPDLYVQCCPQLHQELKSLVGNENLRLEEGEQV